MLLGDDLRLPISELFVSVQGEGTLTGVPSWFIRLSGCNLRCKWCDTPYASWRPEQRNSGGTGAGAEAKPGARETEVVVDSGAAAVPRSGMSIAEIINAPEFTTPDPHTGRAPSIRHAVVTGGEPMMFPGLAALTRALRARAMHITIETAGTICPESPEAFPACDLMSISPKLSNSTPTPEEAIRLSGSPSGAAWSDRHEQRRLNLPALQCLLDAFPAPRRQLKFVVAGEADLREIEALLSGLRGWSPEDVQLMPEGTPPTRERMLWAVRACLDRGWRYCHRVHQDVFGNLRGT